MLHNTMNIKELEIMRDVAKIIVLKKNGYIVDDILTLTNPLTKVEIKHNVYTEDGIKAVRSLFHD